MRASPASRDIMTPGPGADHPLPRQRAFVVQLRAQADATPDRFAGRVEHVVSGQAIHFHSLDAFLGFIARMLAQGAPRRLRAPSPMGARRCPPTVGGEGPRAEGASPGE